ncbi:MAG TPA: hypothetical protein VK395_29880, partial [Gemmataceae bacterium]|nr:hypothetical protein [Gemmataceae bacterium]
FVHWDAHYYTDIAENGYSYAPGQQSTIHFFPAYSVTARLLSSCTGTASDVEGGFLYFFVYNPHTRGHSGAFYRQWQPGRRQSRDQRDADNRFRRPGCH